MSVPRVPRSHLTQSPTSKLPKLSLILPIIIIIYIFFFLLTKVFFKFIYLSVWFSMLVESGLVLSPDISIFTYIWYCCGMGLNVMVYVLS